MFIRNGKKGGKGSYTALCEYGHERANFSCAFLLKCAEPLNDSAKIHQHQ